MSKVVKNIIPALVLLMTLSSWQVLNEDWFLLLLTTTLLLLGFYKQIKIEPTVYYIFAYWTLINAISFIYFKESFNENLYTLLGSFMRLFIAYMLIKLGNAYILFRAEKISFYLILVGLPIFFMIEFFPLSVNLFKAFNLGTTEVTGSSGGWNILIYAKNPWHDFRFTGYAWEPGAAALIIIFGLIISIIRDGYRINLRKSIYLVALIFTFSTAGYLALLFLVMIYLIHYKLERYLLIFLIISPLLFLGIEFIYKQDFISGKIANYIQTSETNQRTGYQNLNADKVSRLDYVFLGGILVQKWPLGYGISNNGKIVSRTGKVLRGSNSLIAILVSWGIIGFIFALIKFFHFFKILSLFSKKHTHKLLIIPLFTVFFSNPIERSPLFYGILFYPIIYNHKTIRELIYNNLLTRSQKTASVKLTPITKINCSF